MSESQNNEVQTEAVETDQQQAITSIQEVLTDLVRGNLERRFTHLEQFGPYSGICSDINDLVDKVETFFREAIGRMEDFGKGQSNCQIDERGFSNTFLETIRLFNGNLNHSDVQRQQQRVVSQTLQETVETLNETVNHMAETAQELGENSTKTLESAETVDTNSTEANSLTDEAANSCKELATAINEIANNMQQANSVTYDAVELANTTVGTISELLKSSDEIGKIIELIDGIAHQTNLLSLNASIEAARAGEQGRGFAVVASEVKNLAFESRKNAKTISKQIVAIRSQADASSQAIERINSVIGEINNISQSVAASTEEQGAATESISGIMQDVSTAAKSIADSITSVAGSARHNNEIAADVNLRIDKLTEISQNLKDLAIKLDT